MNCAIKRKSKQSFSREDQRWMQLACSYARRAQGQSWPNPAVGCVLVSADNILLSVGHTQKGGRPHAEADALKALEQSGNSAALKGGTAYVTLEPCAQEGRGPACADLLLQSGVFRVVYAVDDPDLRVNGQGRDKLVAGGVSVQYGLCEEEAAAGLSGFLALRRFSRPYLTSKIATSADGFISAKIGQQTWLTNDVSRVYAHNLRSRVDAVLTGIETILIDNPELTCRLPGWRESSPIRIIFDSHLRLCSNSKVAQTVAAGPVVVFCSRAANSQDQIMLDKCGIEVVRLDQNADGLDLSAALQWCAKRELSSLLLEAGTKLNHSFYSAGLIDQIIHLSAQKKLKTGVPGLLYDANTRTALAFPRDTDYTKARTFELAGDHLSVWQRGKEMIGKV